MKKFLIRLSFLVFPTLIILGIVEYRLRSFANDYAQKRHYLDTHHDEIEQLILGSSLSWNGIDPRILGRNTYNAAFLGQTLRYDAHILEMYIQKMPQLEDVILTVFYPTMEFKLDEVAENRKDYYSIYFDAWPPALLLDNYNGVQLTQKLLKEKKDSLFSVTSDSLGFGLKDRFSHENPAEMAKRLVRQHTRPVPVQRKFNRKQLEKIVGLCTEEGINLWIFFHPAMDAYIQEIKEEQYQFVDRLCAGLANKNNGIYYNNLFLDKRFDNNMFSDAIHLNRMGADLFSEIIDSTMKSQ